MKGPTTVLTGPAFPQVNLLPADIREARTFGVVKRWMVASVGVTAVAIGAVVAVAQVQTQMADSLLAQADAQTADLLAQQMPFTEVTTVRTELDTLRIARAYALAPEILWSDYLGALVAVTPDGVGISTADFLGATPVAGAPASSDPLVPAGVGTLTFTAVSRDVPDTMAWAEALDAVPGFADARIDRVALADAGSAGALPYEVSGSVQVDAAAYSHRFDLQPQGDS